MWCAARAMVQFWNLFTIVRTAIFPFTMGTGEPVGAASVPFFIIHAQPFAHGCPCGHVCSPVHLRGHRNMSCDGLAKVPLCFCGWRGGHAASDCRWVLHAQQGLVLRGSGGR